MTAETVLVTGPSSGIGREVSKLFADNGSNLVLVSRNEAKLNGLADECRSRHGVEVRVLAEDLTDHEAPQHIYDQLQATGIQVDVLVNNAGFGALGPVAEIDTARQVDMVQVNVAALTHLTRCFLPGMIARGRGGVLNVASIAGFQPGPNMAVYYATKAFVLSFTEALAEELKSTGIKVCCLAPGPTKTGFGDSSGMEKPPLFKSGVMDANAVARAGYEGLRQGKALVIPGRKNKLGVISVRFTPRPMVRKIINRRNTVLKQKTV